MFKKIMVIMLAAAFMFAFSARDAKAAGQNLIIATATTGGDLLSGWCCYRYSYQY